MDEEVEQLWGLHLILAGCLLTLFVALLGMAYTVVDVVRLTLRRKRWDVSRWRRPTPPRLLPSHTPTLHDETGHRGSSESSTTNTGQFDVERPVIRVERPNMESPIQQMDMPVKQMQIPDSIPVVPFDGSKTEKTDLPPFRYYHNVAAPNI